MLFFVLEETKCKLNAMSDLKPSPEEIAQTLMQDVQVLMDYYRSNEYPVPSFAEDSPAHAVPETAPRHVKIARDAAMNSALKIFDMFAGPSQFLSNLTVSVSRANPCFICRNYSWEIKREEL